MWSPKPSCRMKVLMGLGAFLAIAEAYNGTVTAALLKARRYVATPPPAPFVTHTSRRPVPSGCGPVLGIPFQSCSSLTHMDLKPPNRALESLMSSIADGQAGVALWAQNDPPADPTGLNWRLPKQKKKEAANEGAEKSSAPRTGKHTAEKPAHPFPSHLHHTYPESRLSLAPSRFSPSPPPPPRPRLLLCTFLSSSSPPPPFLLPLPVCPADSLPAVSSPCTSPRPFTLACSLAAAQGTAAPNHRPPPPRIPGRTHPSLSPGYCSSSHIPPPIHSFF